MIQFFARMFILNLSVWAVSLATGRRSRWAMAVQEGGMILGT